MNGEFGLTPGRTRWYANYRHKYIKSWGSLINP